MEIIKFFERIKSKESFKEILKRKKISLAFTKNEYQLEELIRKIGKMNLITGQGFTKKYSNKLNISGKKFSIKNESFSEVYRIMKNLEEGPVVGFGGGRVLDVSKMISYQTGRKLILIPTAPTHDGLISKNSALITNGSKKSFSVNYPKRVVVPKDLWESSGELKKFGELDVLSNIVALQDVSLSMEEINFKPEKNYMNLSMLAIKYSLGDSMEELAEALFLSGLAMESSSRYCSGSDHEIEKILALKTRKYFHGQIAGTGALISAKVYEDYSKKFKSLFFNPDVFFQELLEIMKKKKVLEEAIRPIEENKEVEKWLKKSSYIRPERYTIWNKINSEKINWKKIINGILNAC